MVTQKQTVEVCPELPTQEHLAGCLRCQEIARAVTADVPRGFTQSLPFAPASVVERGRFNELGLDDQVDRYRIRRRLGLGGMGVVYLAFDPQLNRNVALKLFNGAAQGLSSSSNERLLLEARAMAQLQHPNVVAIHDVGLFQGTVFLAMQYVEGRTLRQWAQEQARGWREWRQVMQEAGKGLAAAHRRGLVHLDFKPDNVLVASNGQVFVTDFGLARQTEQRDSGSERGGTMGYMAPEQLMDGKLDVRTDIFSFCVTFYEGLFGAKPFKGKNAQQYLTAVRRGASVKGPEEVPEWLSELVLRGLAFKPSDRHGSMGALIEATPRLLAVTIRCAVKLFEKEAGASALAKVYESVTAKYPTFTPRAVDEEGAWLEFAPSMELCERMVEFRQDASFMRRAGHHLASREVMGSAFDVLRILGSPMSAYRLMISQAGKFNQVGAFEVMSLSARQLSFSYTSDIPETTSACCELRKGQFESIPRIWGLPVGRIEESGCQVKGGKSCVYYLQWEEPRRYRKAWMGTLSILAAHLAALAAVHQRPERLWWVMSVSTAAIVALALALRNGAESKIDEKNRTRPGSSRDPM